MSDLTQDNHAYEELIPALANKMQEIFYPHIKDATNTEAVELLVRTLATYMVGTLQAPAENIVSMSFDFAQRMCNAKFRMDEREKQARYETGYSGLPISIHPKN